VRAARLTELRIAEAAVVNAKNAYQTACADANNYYGLLDLCKSLHVDALHVNTSRVDASQVDTLRVDALMSLQTDVLYLVQQSLQVHDLMNLQLVCKRWLLFTYRHREALFKRVKVPTNLRRGDAAVLLRSALHFGGDGQAGGSARGRAQARKARPSGKARKGKEGVGRGKACLSWQRGAETEQRQ
jgi:hypothetical protein